MTTLFPNPGARIAEGSEALRERESCLAGFFAKYQQAIR